MSLEIWLPHSALDSPPGGRLVYRCSCGKEFPRPEQKRQFTRHAVACLRRREAEIDRLSHQGHIGPLDQDRFDWIKKREEDKRKVDYEKDGVMI